MLELRPTCENCNKSLPPASLEAMICSFECTFCVDCVTTILENVCPNCGGGFCQRPIRPSQNHHEGNYLGKYPPSSTVRHRPVDKREDDRQVILTLRDKLKYISPESR